MNRRAGTISFACGKSDFVFARQLERQRIGKQTLGDSHGISRHIKQFIPADTRIRTRRNVANRVSASTFRRKPNFRQGAQRRNNRIQRHAMHLKLLAGGNVQNAVAEFRRHFAQPTQVRRRHTTGGGAHPQHVGPVLALFIDPSRNTNDAELAFVDRARLELRQHILKFIQFRLDTLRNSESPSVIRLFFHNLFFRRIKVKMITRK